MLTDFTIIKLLNFFFSFFQIIPKCYIFTIDGLVRLKELLKPCQVLFGSTSSRPITAVKNTIKCTLLEVYCCRSKKLSQILKYNVETYNHYPKILINHFVLLNQNFESFIMSRSPELKVKHC